jgi:hypothetical protein
VVAAVHDGELVLKPVLDAEGVLLPIDGLQVIFVRPGRDHQELVVQRSGSGGGRP